MLSIFLPGNPTYQIPEVLSFSVNATLSSLPAAAGSSGGGSEENGLRISSHASSRALSGSGLDGTGGSPASAAAAFAAAPQRRRRLASSSGAGAKSNGGGSSGATRSTVSFQLYSAGDRRSAAVWAAGENRTLPTGLSDYDPTQLQLLCASPVSPFKGP